MLGSIFTRCEHLLVDSMREVLEKETLLPSLSVCEIRPAELGEQIGDFAALSVAAEAIRAS